MTRSTTATVVSLLWLGIGIGVAAVTPGSAHAAGPYCTGEYADDLTSLSPRVREYERDAANQYSYCLRTTATYECLSYASDGSVRRSRKTVVAHGTGFAYRRAGGETFLVTNEHVAAWPAVTDDEHTVEDVPAGCKRVSGAIRIVDSEDDGFEGNDIALTTVVEDAALDAAILKTRTPLRLIPYRVGKSASLRVGNVVAVRGFPLGAFAAHNLGKVVNAYDHDTSKEWDHVDFVTDALLSPGNSGSPVLALSCASGEYELVGIYHAGYIRGSALNVVVGIDQVRELMTTLKRPARPAEAQSDRLGAPERELVRLTLAQTGASAFFPLGPLVASVRQQSAPSGDALWFELYSKGFPLSDDRVLVVEDLGASAPADGFGRTGRVFVGNGRGLRPLERASLDGEEQAALERLVVRLRTAAVATARYRSTDGSQRGTKRRKAIERQRERQAALDTDAAQVATDFADRMGPHAGDAVVALADVLASPAVAPPPVEATAPPPKP